MILVSKIKQFQDFEGFDSFDWAGNELSQFNLIYGWNGCGKTTISRLFYSLENRMIIEKLGNPAFILQTPNGQISNRQLETHSMNIRVFNEDFVKDYLQFNESKTKKILIVGKENKDISEAIDSLTKEKNRKAEEYKGLEKQQKELPDIELILRDCGSEVVKQFSNTPLGSVKYSGRNYNRTEVKRLLRDKSISLDNRDQFIIADQKNIDVKRDIIRSQKSKIGFKQDAITDYSSLFSNANNLLEISLEVKEMNNLNDDDKLRKWTETGYHLHKDRSSSKCLFCRNRLEASFLSQLANYFTVEIENTKNQIDAAINKVEAINLIQEINGVEESKLFPDLSEDYFNATSTLHKHARKIQETNDKLIMSLKVKRDNLQRKGNIFEPISYPDQSIQDYNNSISKIRDIVTRHNSKIDTVDQAAKEIELHTIADVLKKEEYFEKESIAKSVNDKIIKTKTELAGC